MAVTGLRRRWLGAMMLLAMFSASLYADTSTDLRHCLSDVATSLSSGHAEQAMSVFDKEEFPQYEKLKNYFAGLTSAYQVDSQIDVTDEDASDTAASLTVRWALTLTDEGSGLDQRRDAELTVKLIRKKGRWKIVSLAPLEIFNPQQKP